MKYLIKILVFIISSNIYSQGCSDAGLCALQNTKEVDDFLTKQNQIGFGLGYGLGLNNVKFLNANLDYGYILNEKISFSSKLTYQNATGEFGSNSKLGDAFLALNYRISTTNIYDFRFLLGGKIPLNSSDSKNNDGFQLPMEYQSSLGTYDVLVGATMIYDKKLDLTLSFQIPVINKNQNQYVPINFNNSDKYSQTTGFERKSDAVIKVGYLFMIPESRFSIKPNLLSIFHLGNDSFTDSLNNKFEIKESEGLTLNCVVNTILTLRNDSQLVFSLATPSPLRTTKRPDGLIRAFGINLQYIIKF